jgi:hypothetical protein
MTYATDQVWEDVAYVAFHLHWSMDGILDLDHALRRRLITLIAQLDQQARSGR